MDESEEVIFKTFLSPTLLTFSKLSSYSSDAASFEIGMKATEHYWLAVYSSLYGKVFVQHVLNPIQTDGWHKVTEIRKRKNNTIDSVLIADLIRYGQFVETYLAEECLFFFAQPYHGSQLPDRFHW